MFFQVGLCGKTFRTHFTNERPVGRVQFLVLPQPAFVGERLPTRLAGDLLPMVAIK